MKLLVDAQLPVRLAREMNRAGHDTKHTIDLPGGNRSTDAQVTAAADAEGRVVVSKDDDFRISHQLHGRPARLLVVALGNVTNNELLAVLDKHLTNIVEAFDTCDRVELHPTRIVGWPREPSDHDE